jgi:hypothetical protein
MRLGHIMFGGSGNSSEDCHFLAMRFNEKWGFKPDVGETWVGQMVDDETYMLYGGLGWFTGLWRSPTGKVFVSAADDEIHMNPDPEPRAAPWRVEALRGTLTGVWGLSDDLVFTWGVLSTGPVVYRYDGSAWSSVPPPPGEIMRMHGCAPDLIYAVGSHGLIARFDGTGWTRLPSPTGAGLSDVFVASEDEMYAVGPGRQLLRGSVHGWTELMEGPAPMFGVVRWNGEVWVGASEAGLMKLDGTELVVVKPNVKAEKLDARQELLVSSPQLVVSSADGIVFRGLPVAAVADMFADDEPAWLEPEPSPPPPSTVDATTPEPAPEPTVTNVAARTVFEFLARHTMRDEYWKKTVRGEEVERHMWVQYASGDDDGLFALFMVESDDFEDPDDPELQALVDHAVEAFRAAHPDLADIPVSTRLDLA